MALDGNHVRIPNSQVFRARITNYTANPLRRFDFTFGVGMRESLIEVRNETLDLLRSITGVLAEPQPLFAIDELGDSAVTIHLYAWIDQRASDWLAVRTEAIRRVKVALERRGIDLPEPIYRVVTVRDVTEAESEAKEMVDDDGLLQSPDAVSELDRQIEGENVRSPEPNLLER